MDNAKFKKLIRKIPPKTGVYLFKNRSNQIIYIGRSINLRKRLEDHLNSQNLKTKQFIAEAKNILWKITKNILEAIILESNLIKKYQPPYNIREKDNRSFVYIFIPKKKWSYPLLIRGQELKKYKLLKGEIFGPFKSLTLVRNLLRLLRQVFPYSVCQLNILKPCFHYQIGLCPGKCLGIISEREYQKNIDYLIRFLRGKKENLRKILKKNAPEKLELLENIDDSALIGQEKDFSNLENNRIEAYDVSHLAGYETYGAMVVFQENDFKKSEYRLFKIRNAKPKDDIGALSEMMMRRMNHREWHYPDLILIDGGKPQIQAIEKILKERKINIPVIGIVKKEKDELVFSRADRTLKELIYSSFEELRKIRDEAHRFANFARKKLLTKRFLQDLV